MSKRLTPPGGETVLRPAKRWDEVSVSQPSGHTRHTLSTPTYDDSLIDGGVGAMSAHEIQRQQSREAKSEAAFSAKSLSRGEQAEQFFHLSDKLNDTEFII